jgi:VanZ family protein
MRVNRNEFLLYTVWAGQATAVFAMGAVFASLLREQGQDVKFFGLVAGTCVLLAVGAEVFRTFLIRKKLRTVLNRKKATR